MFKTLKYLLFAGLYQKAKRSFLVLFGSIITLILINLIISDAVGVSSGMSVYFLLTIKWTANLFLLWLIGFNALKIFNIATNPFASKQPKVKVIKESDTKKDRILAKETLLTKSDLILQKYMKDQ
jgi:uncharacterized membrane protein